MGEGDRNTKFFHSKANARRRINSISTLVDRAGVTHSNRDDIETVADFTAACFSILNEGDIPPGSNDTLIVLIPKQKSATRMEDFRPISLTSVVSKTVAKVIVNRLQLILPEVISPAQSAFVKGRLITDNYLIAHEALKIPDMEAKGTDR
ncbi:hypothetical protein QQ045_006048 [Rhodiola kirilowii]